MNPGKIFIVSVFCYDYLEIYTTSCYFHKGLRAANLKSFEDRSVCN